MSGNIKARETLQMLLDYPEREYPEPEDPNDKKKKKKGDAFPTPEWATELEAVIAKVKSMEQLAADKANLKLNEDFCKRV